MLNIEKSVFRQGQYVGYGGGKVWRISKSNSSFGNWFAHNQDDFNEKLYAMKLKELSEKLAELSHK